MMKNINKSIGIIEASAKKAGITEKGESKIEEAPFSEEKGNAGNPEKLADTLNRVGVARLFLFLTISGYVIIAFSKGQIGINEKDLSLYLVFLVFIFSFFVLLKFFGFLNRNIQEFTSVFEGLKFLLKRKKRYFVLLILIIGFITLIFYSKKEIITTTEQTLNFLTSRR